MGFGLTCVGIGAHQVLVGGWLDQVAGTKGFSGRTWWVTPVGRGYLLAGLSQVGAGGW